MPKLSVIVITKNEAANIDAALTSVRWADELIVVDAESTDDTVARARQFTDRVFVRAWPGYAAQKNHAASLASHDWILSLDADERVTPELATSIQQALKEAPSARGYRVRRATWVFDRWLRSTDWYPDWQLRLYDRRAGRWTEDRRVHESVALDGPVARLDGELQHYGYRGIAAHADTINRYTTHAAQDLHARGARASATDLVLQAPAAFLRNYLLRGGIRDGLVGLVISGMNAYYVHLKYVKLWEQARRTAQEGDLPPRG